MLKLELRSETSVRPGFAQLWIRNWQGASHGVMLSILRNQDHCYLASDGQWVGNEVRHTLADLQWDDDAAWVTVGPDIVDAVMAERQMAYRLSLTDGSATDHGVLVIAADVLSSLASGSTEIVDRVIAAAPVIPEPEPVVVPQPEPEIPPEPVTPAPPVIDPAPQPVKPTSSLLWLWIAIAVVVIVGGAVAAWLLLKSPATPASAPSVPTPAAQVEPVGACAPGAMSAAGELEFVKACLKTQPNNAEVLAIIKQAKEQKQCEVAQRLYAYKAQSGDTAIALSYAHEYDPSTAVSGGCFQADAETAVYWYETVIHQDPKNAEAQARLSALKK